MINCGYFHMEKRGQIVEKRDLESASVCYSCYSGNLEPPLAQSLFRTSISLT